MLPTCAHGKVTCGQKISDLPDCPRLPVDNIAIGWLYSFVMGTHSVAEAKNRLPELIDRALEGEGIVITRHGRPVVELKPIPEPLRPLSPPDLNCLPAPPPTAT